MEQKLKIAVFIDFDNIEIGVKSTLHREFDVAAVLDALKERGEIVTKFAYANWGRQESATRALSEHAVQMVQRDPSPRGDKNGADINLALDALEIINEPLAAIAKREEILYVYGQEKDPVALDHHSPVLHLIQLIRDEAHRFAVTFHRKRRQMRDRSTELLEIPGVGASTTRRLLEHFGSVQAVKQADPAALSAVVTRTQAEAIKNHFQK